MFHLYNFLCVCIDVFNKFSLPTHHMMLGLDPVTSLFNAVDDSLASFLH